MSKQILLTSNQAAQRLGTTQRQIQRLAFVGLLPVYAFGPRGTLIFRSKDVDKAPTSTT